MNPPIQPTIFVVGAAPAEQDELAAILARAGYRARLFASAEEVLEQADRESPTCIITELNLPGISGLELTSTLRSRNSLVPVIILTRHADVASAVHALRNDVSDYVTRPFVERDLVRRVRNAVAQAEPTTS